MIWARCYQIRSPRRSARETDEAAKLKDVAPLLRSGRARCRSRKELRGPLGVSAAPNTSSGPTAMATLHTESPRDRVSPSPAVLGGDSHSLDPGQFQPTKIRTCSGQTDESLIPRLCTAIPTSYRRLPYSRSPRVQSEGLNTLRTYGIPSEKCETSKR